MIQVMELQSEKSVELMPVTASAALLPVTVIVAVRNEAQNLRRCLGSLRNFGEVYVVDSQSTDGTVEIAEVHGVKVAQFHYRGGWPKKRQWAMDTLPLRYDWILLLDADEALTPELEREIGEVILNSVNNGYHLKLQMFFLGRNLSGTWRSQIAGYGLFRRWADR